MVIVILTSKSDMRADCADGMERACAGDEVVTTTSEWGGEDGYG
jgi:hypothetical protein